MLRERWVTIVLLLAMCFSLVSTINISTVKAQTTISIYIREDGAVEGTDNIQRNGDVYTLTGNVLVVNVSLGISIERSNIVLDGAGYTLQGTGIEQGIAILGTNVTIKNLQIYNFKTAINLVNAKNCSIIGNLIFEFEQVGITLMNGDFLIENNSIVNNFKKGSMAVPISMSFANSGTKIFTENNFFYGGIGYFLSSGSHFFRNYWIDYNGIDNNEDGIGDTPYTIYDLDQIKLEDPQPLMTPIDIPLFPEPSRRIYIRGDGSVEETENIQKDGNIYSLISDIDGSIVIERDNIVINGADHNLQGSGTENGIILKDVNNVNITNFSLSNFNIGIVLMDSNDNTILENDITNCFRGLDLTSSENNTISKNYITNNIDGIALENIRNTIVENLVTNNTNIGIFLYGAGHNDIIANDITKNGVGISVSNCYNNWIYHNNFVSNINHVESDDSADIWNIEARGNYWDTYKGFDNNNDQIGDTPYIINENNQDNYPLMNQWIPSGQSETFPLELVAIAMVAIVGVSFILLIYFKIIRKSNKQEI